MKKAIFKNKTLISIPEIKEYKNKYQLAAEEIYAFLGKDNFSNVYNCMTRFRATIKDNEQVNLEKIKKIPLVKGTNWNGKELQIIIGGEVGKVTDEFKKYEIEVKNRATLKNTDKVEKKKVSARIMAAISGIIGPSIPILMAAGMLAALQVILVQTKVIADAGGMENIANVDLWTGIFYIMSKVILMGIGTFFIYNTCQYFGGNPIYGIAIGLTFMARGLWSAAATPIDLENAQFGDWVSSTLYSKTGWLLFKIGDYPLIIGGYESSILPYIAGGILVTYLDKWIKTWMPSVVDIVFRPTLIYLISITLLWFGLAPILSLIEFGLGKAVMALGYIPFGIGVALFSFLWQPLVLTGMHWSIGMPTMIPIMQGQSSLIYPGYYTATFAQVGAAIGLILVTKNANLKKVATAGVVAGVFGITEPIIFGANLPKVRPFVLGCVGAFFGGMVSGLLGVTTDVIPGEGIFSITGLLGGPKEIAFAVLSWVIAMGIAGGLTALLYKERKDEFNYFKKGVNKLGNLLYSKDEKEVKLAMKKEFEVYEKEIKSMKNDYRKMNKYYSEISRYEQQLISWENKESKHRGKLYKELIKLKNRLLKKPNDFLLNRFNKLNQDYSTYNLDKQKNQIQMKLDKLTAEHQEFLQKFSQEKENLYKKVCAKTSIYKNEENQNNILTVENIFYNALNSVEIGFGIEDAKSVSFRKKID